MIVIQYSGFQSIEVHITSQIAMQGVLLPLMMWMIWILGSSAEEENLRRSPRVVGGHPSDVRNHPHMVNIRRRGNFECGGSLVTPHCVLTAAHCLKDGQPSDFVVRGGVTYLSDMRNSRYVRKILLPSAYSRNTLDYDVAILKLQQPLQASIAQPISLAARSPRPGTFVRVSGWGLTDDSSTSLPNQLHSVHVQVMPQRECRDLYHGYRNITNSMFCASVPGIKDACAADSGGPVVNSNGFLVGVVSWGRANRCAAKDSPGVYSDVVFRCFCRISGDKSRGKVTTITVHIEMLWRWEYLIIGMVLLAELTQLGDAVATTNQRKNRRLRSSNGNKLAARRNQNGNKSSGNRARKLAAKRVNQNQKATTSDKIQSRIVGGTSTSISTTPYIVQVRRGSNLCGGSLITERWVLTAAHCVKGYSASDFTVRGGTTTLDGSDGITRSVSSVHLAPKFTSKKMNMDAALLKLNQSLTGTNIGTISMASYRPKAGSKVRIAGWGVTKEGSTTASKTLQFIQTRVVKQKKCRSDYRGKASITNYMICARSAGKDSCSGDSGGPVTRNNDLVAIVSFGYGCARAGYPGVYTAVSSIRQWANNVMANN